MLPLLICIGVGACSSSDGQRIDNADTENTTAPCVTEEMLREAHASESDIRQFKKDQAKLNREETCD